VSLPPENLDGLGVAARKISRSPPHCRPPSFAPLLKTGVSGQTLTKDLKSEARWGTGDPGYKIKAEFSDCHHDRGVISMARSQDPDSAGSQFFICHGTPRFLDRQYTAFGKLVKGDDVLEKIATTTTRPQDRPVKRMGVESIKIVAADSVK
jgi:peptidyl-prolyl cis-trans isomerase B (cyclophilin B)